MLFLASYYISSAMHSRFAFWVHSHCPQCPPLITELWQHNVNGKEREEEENVGAIKTNIVIAKFNNTAAISDFPNTIQNTFLKLGQWSSIHPLSLAAYICKVGGWVDGYLQISIAKG